MSAGLIYILSNPSFKSKYYKIGMTTRTAEDRAWEIYTGATGVPEPFYVEYTVFAADCENAEKRIHKVLEKYRINEGREFFRIGLAEAIHASKTIVSKVNNEIKLSGKEVFNEFLSVELSDEYEGEAYLPSYSSEHYINNNTQLKSMNSTAVTKYHIDTSGEIVDECKPKKLDLNITLSSLIMSFFALFVVIFGAMQSYMLINYAFSSDGSVITKVSIAVLGAAGIMMVYALIRGRL